MLPIVRVSGGSHWRSYSNTYGGWAGGMYILLGGFSLPVCVCVCVCACVHAWMRACVCACVRACVCTRACVRRNE